MSTLDSFVAQYLIYVCMVIAVMVWLRLPREQKWGLAATTVIAGIIALALMKLGASLYVDQRPFVTSHVAPLFPHAADSGFPSDHTLTAMLMAGCVVFCSRRWGAVLAALALWIGLARVEALVHRPIDIVGAVAMVLVAAALGHLLALAVLRRWPSITRLGFSASGAEPLPTAAGSSTSDGGGSRMVLEASASGTEQRPVEPVRTGSRSSQTTAHALWTSHALTGIAVLLVAAAVALWLLELAGDVI
jgi:undecaprenyl-diphosphatase